MGRTLGTVNDIKLVQWKLLLCRKILNGCLQFAVFKRSKFVEKGLDQDGEDGHSNQLESQDKHTHINDERFAEMVENLQKASKYRGDKDNPQSCRFQRVYNEQFFSQLVEPEFFFQDKIVIVRRRQANDVSHN